MKFIVFAVGALIAASSLPAVDLIVGHFETQIDYQLSPGDPDAGWSSWVSFDEDDNFNDQVGITRLDPGTVDFIVPPEAAAVGPGGVPMAVLPQNRKPGQLYLGWRTVIAPDAFQRKVAGGPYQPGANGTIASELISLSGTGPDRGGSFTMWTSTIFGSDVHFDSSDGIDAQDLLEGIPSGEHEHYNWGFSKPGTYEATFRYFGRLNPWQGGADTESTQSYRFKVTFPGFLEATGDELHLASAGAAPNTIALYDPALDVEYSPRQAALLAAPVSIDGSSYPLGSVVTLRTDASASDARVGIPGSTPIAFGGSVTPATGTDALELISFTGPGNAQLTPLGGDQLLFQFSEIGIYRLRLRTVGSQNGTPVNGAATVLTFLAGYPMDYTYTQWADSFERTHGLAGGALADASADYDADGVANGVEFQLFWHGLDPVVSDGHLLPRPEYSEGAARLRYLRDLHKDNLSGVEPVIPDSTPWTFSAAHSNDLETIVNPNQDESLHTIWRAWIPLRSEGEPNAFYEDGARRGSELGPVMERQLVVPGANPKCGFFRWELRSDP